MKRTVFNSGVLILTLWVSAVSLGQEKTPGDVNKTPPTVVEPKKANKKWKRKNLAGLLWDTPFQTVFFPDGGTKTEPNSYDPFVLNFTEKLRIQSALTNGTLKNAELWSDLFQKQVEAHLFELSETEGQTQFTLRGSVKTAP